MCTERPVATDLGLWLGSVAEVIRLVMTGLAGPPAKEGHHLLEVQGPWLIMREVSAACVILELG